MRRLAFASLLALTGCPGGDICMSTGAPTASSSFAIAGTPVTIPMTLAVSCGARMPSGVTISVLGPNDENVPADGGTVAVDSTGFTAGITFTPVTPGGYHIAARFEPNLGLTQFDVLAAADRRGATPAFTTTPSNLSACTHVEVTTSGRLVCITANHAAVFAPGSSTPDHLDGITEYVDDTLWVANNGTLSRLVDSDAGFVVSETAPIDFVPSVLLPTVADVVASNSLGAELLTPQDGGFSVRTLAPIADSNAPDWRSGDVYGTLDVRSLCTEPLDGGTVAACTPLTSFTTGLQTFGIDTGGFWGTEAIGTSPSTTFVYHISPEASLSLKLPSDWSPMMTSTGGWEHAPLLSSSSSTMVLNGDIGLETFTNDGETLDLACTRFVVVSSNGSSRVIAR